MAKRKSDSKAVGRIGEQIVQDHLTRLGWTIVRSNYRCPIGELDIIAEEPGKNAVTLVFIEVKTRRGTAHGAPISAVDERKRARIVDAANYYLGEVGNGGAEPQCRFDVAEVRIGPDGRHTIVLHHGAFTG